jgi:hypothetical protein
MLKNEGPLAFANGLHATIWRHGVFNLVRDCQTTALPTRLLLLLVVGTASYCLLQSTALHCSTVLSRHPIIVQTTLCP